jgi:hypothetical protein
VSDFPQESGLAASLSTAANTTIKELNMNILRKALDAIMTLWERETEQQTYERLTAARNRGLVRFINESTDLAVDAGSVLSIAISKAPALETGSDPHAAALPSPQQIAGMERPELVALVQAHGLDVETGNYKRVDHLRTAVTRAVAAVQPQ